MTWKWKAESDDGTAFERYPQLNSIQQDEMIYLLKHQLKALEERIAKLETKT